MNHPLQWTSASASWKRRLQQAGAFVEPSLLMFDRDDFMAALQAHLSPPPRPDGSPAAPGDLAPFDIPLPPNDEPPTLFHPAHGRFYLVAASLVCRLPGLPDHRVDAARREQALCVLRRVRDGQEEAWVPTIPGEGVWHPVETEPARPDPRAHILPGEELRPMFPVVFRDGDRTRRLWAALVPVASRETYRAGQRLAGGPPPGDLLLVAPRARVRNSLASLQAMQPLSPLGMAQVQQAFLFFLELADLFTTHFPAAFAQPTAHLPSLPAGTKFWLDVAWPNRDVIRTQSLHGPITAEHESMLAALLALDPAALDQELLTALRAARIEDPGDSASSYIVRCVYRRPACKPPHPDLISAPSRSFSLAAFFASDAPARAIRIDLPLDTAALAAGKTPRGVAFVVSSALRAQLSRIGKLKDVLDDKLAAGGSFDAGEIVAMSLPIITLCAFIVLSIFLSLLNILFFWLPAAIVRLPIPRRSPS